MGDGHAVYPLLMFLLLIEVFDHPLVDYRSYRGLPLGCHQLERPLVGHRHHIVFTPKYRRKAIYGQIRSDIGEILRRLCEHKGVEIIEGHLMPDHVHMLLAIPPKYSVSGVMGYLKGKSSLMIFDKHANLKYRFGNRRFWAEGCYVSTVGLNILDDARKGKSVPSGRAEPELPGVPTRQARIRRLPWCSSRRACCEHVDTAASNPLFPIEGGGYFVSWSDLLRFR